MSLFYLQCSISRQNCDSIWPRATSQQVAFTRNSCVRDPRIPGDPDLGRCGWAGASCQINGTVSNCAWPYAEVCRNGFCAGGVGQPCIPIGERYICNDPVHCNVTVGLGPRAVCGGEGATVNAEDGPRGLDFGLDYCYSGRATQNGSLYWVCTDGPDPVTPLPATNAPTASTARDAASPTAPALSNLVVKKSKMIGPIVGAVLGGLLLLALLAILCYRRRAQRQSLYRIDAWKSEEHDPQAPGALLHRRGLSDQSDVSAPSRISQSTATSLSHGLPISTTDQPPEMRSVQVSGTSKFALIQQRTAAAAAAAASPSLSTESSDILSQDSHIPPSLPRKGFIAPITNTIIPAPFADSTVTLSQDSHIISPITSPPVPATVMNSNIPIPPIPPQAAVSFVTRDRSGRRTKSRNASTPTPTLPVPDSPPVFTEDVEQRLLELRNEADRGLAELRAQRTGDQEMPPPYHLP